MHVTKYMRDHDQRLSLGGGGGMIYLLKGVLNTNTKIIFAKENLNVFYTSYLKFSHVMMIQFKDQ